jgi:tetratricopeptide (TPR) repeat protein
LKLLRLLALIVAIALFSISPLRAEGAWTQVDTPNFVVIGNVPESRLRDAAERLEVFRSVLAALLPPTKARPPRTIVLAFNSDRAFAPYRPLFEGKPVEVAGYFIRHEDRAYIALGDATNEQAFRTVYHEFSHYLTDTALNRVPVWVGEGLAGLYETFDVTGKTAYIGRPGSLHAGYLRQSTFIPLSQLIGVEHDSAIYNRESHRRGVFYSQSWALVHYLVFGSEQRRGQLQQYLRAFENGSSSEAAFKAAFGDEKALDGELRDYIRQFTIPVLQVTFAEKLQATAIARGHVIDDAEAEGHLGAVLAALNRPADARVEFERTLARRPEAILPAVGLGRLTLHEGRTDDAIRILEAVAGRAVDNFDAQVALARALVQSAQEHGDDNAIVAKARVPLSRAVELDGMAAEPAALLGWVELRTEGDAARAVTLLERAIALAPDREDYRLFLAEAFIRTRDLDRATTHLGPLIGSAKSEEVRASARRMLAYVAELKQPNRATAGSRPVPGANPRGSGGVSAPPQIIPALRPVSPGEERVLGLFTGVECKAGAGALIVEASGATLRLAAAKLDQVQFISYRQDAPGSVGCGTFPNSHRVLATYKKLANGGLEAVAIELLPDGYEPK